MCTHVCAQHASQGRTLDFSPIEWQQCLELSFVQAVVACSVTVPRVCTLVQAKIRQDTRLWHYSGLKPTMFASSVQAAVASNVTAWRVCTLVLFILEQYLPPYQHSDNSSQE